MGMFVFVAIGVLLVTGGVVCTVVGLRRVAAAGGVAAPRRSGQGAARGAHAKTAGKSAAAKGASKASAGTSKDDGGSPWIVRCAECDRKLRIPYGRGILQVICPRCEKRFSFDSSAGQVVS